MHKYFFILAPGPPSGIKLTAEAMSTMVTSVKTWKYTATWNVSKNLTLMENLCTHFGHY